MAEEPQRTKTEAASSYDYENDPRWADYWSNVLIPPNMASRSDVITHFTHKFYKRYIDPDLVVEPMSSSSSSSSQQHRSSTTTTSSTIIPLVPRNLSNRAYRLSFVGTTSSSLYSLYSLYEKPRAWSLSALQTYIQLIIATKDFIVFIYCLSFVTSHLCLKFALIPIICPALEHVAKYLRRNFSRSILYRKYLEVPCVWVESNNATLNILTSHAEIVLGFMLIISLFSWQRNIIQTFMYWQVLQLAK